MVPKVLKRRISWKMKKILKQLLFLEPVNKDTNEDELIERLIIRLEPLGFNIIGRQEEQRDEN